MIAPIPTAILNMASSLVKGYGLSGFTNPSKSSNPLDNINLSSGQYFMFVFILIIMIYFTMFIGAMIFNASVTKAFSFVKPVTTGQFFGIYLVTQLLFN